MWEYEQLLVWCYVLTVGRFRLLYQRINSEQLHSSFHFIQILFGRFECIGNVFIFYGFALVLISLLIRFVCFVGFVRENHTNEKSTFVGGEVTKSKLSTKKRSIKSNQKLKVIRGNICMKEKSLLGTGLICQVLINAIDKHVFVASNPTKNLLIRLKHTTQ